MSLSNEAQFKIVSPLVLKGKLIGPYETLRKYYMKQN